MKSPWVTGNVTFTEKLQKQAVVWLARRLKKSILRLTAEDYAEHSLRVIPGNTLFYRQQEHIQCLVAMRLAHAVRSSAACRQEHGHL